MQRQFCHFCQRRIRDQPDLFMAKCCKPCCYKYYCIDCIQFKFQKNYVPSMYKADTWICYYCQKTCVCAKCLSKRTTPKQSKGMKEEVPTPKKAMDEQEEQDMDYWGTREQEVKWMDQEDSSGDEMPAGKEGESFYLMNNDDFIMLPAFEKRLVERRQRFCRFVLSRESRGKSD